MLGYTPAQNISEFGINRCIGKWRALCTRFSQMEPVPARNLFVWSRGIDVLNLRLRASADTLAVVVFLHN